MRAGNDDIVFRPRCNPVSSLKTQTPRLLCPDWTTFVEFVYRTPLSNGASYRFSKEHAFTSNGRILVATVSVPWSELEKAHQCYWGLMAIQKAEEDLLAQKEAVRSVFHDLGMFFRDETVATTSSKRSREL